MRAVTDADSASATNPVDVVDYTYNDNGIRVEKYTFKVAQNYLDTVDEQTYATNSRTVAYVIDGHDGILRDRFGFFRYCSPFGGDKLTQINTVRSDFGFPLPWGYISRE